MIAGTYLQGVYEMLVEMIFPRIFISILFGVTLIDVGSEVFVTKLTYCRTEIITILGLKEKGKEYYTSKLSVLITSYL